MDPLELVGAILILFGSVALGTVAHELSHALSLKLFDISYDVWWFGTRESRGLRAPLSGTLVAVVPQKDCVQDAATELRIASLAPFVLAVPVTLIPLGCVANPFATGNLALQLSVVGWLACAIPSPQDFSLVWYAASAIETVEGKE